MDPIYDLLAIGAGPTGLACAIEAKRAGLRPLVIDKGCLCNSIYHFPTNMIFFTTAERLEIGDFPLTSAETKPTRAEALKYYRRTADHYALELRPVTEERHRRPRRRDSRVHTQFQRPEHTHKARKIVLATGYYDRVNLMNVPGENLPHVSHYFTDPHPYWQQDVVVIGAKNSAAEAALELFRAGARVTLVHRGADLGKTPQILGQAGHRKSHPRRRNPRPIQHQRQANRTNASPSPQRGARRANQSQPAKFSP